MKGWKGKWLVGVALIHLAIALFAFASLKNFGGLARSSQDFSLAAAVWYVLVGAVLLSLGFAIAALESTSSNLIPKSLGWSLLALAVLGVCLVPLSVFWLVFPPAISILAPRLRADSRPLVT